MGTHPFDLSWNWPWLTTDFPCPSCGKSVQSKGHSAEKQSLFDHDIDIVVCPKMVDWKLVWTPRDTTRRR